MSVTRPATMPMSLRLTGLCLAAAVVVGWPGAVTGQTPPGPEALEFFERRVRPVLAEKCFGCHGPKRQKSELRLDSRAGQLRGGERGPAVVPGDPEMSRMVAAIRYGDPDLQMPPKTKLGNGAIADLERWVAMGAPWPPNEEEPEPGSARSVFDLEQRRRDHWAFEAPAAVPAPAVRDATWPTSDLDRFVLARLEREGLAPAAAADRRTLIRRASFDLLGLPPTPEEVDAFVSDSAADAWPRVVDRLLASPHFGERWGRHWLDLVRYAESRGHEFDLDIANAWQYRDYVIRALNADVPYDRFVMEHIAGDLMPEPRLHPEEGYWESVLGTGFWHLGEEVHSPVDIRADETGRIDNKIDVFSKAFLGLTVSCARCHDHKFDAISTADYYALSGYVLSSSYRQVRFESTLDNQRIAEELAELAERDRPQLVRSAANSFRSQLAGFADCLLGANEVLRAGAAPGGEAPVLVDYVFEDFESGDFAGWTVSGTAFGEAPVRVSAVPKHQGDLGARGKGLINSHASAGTVQKERDLHEGELRSPIFRLERDHVHFLLGGGKHEGETGVRLVVDGEVVRSATGHNDNRMRPRVFDVRDLRGRDARIEIFDHATEGWGNVGVDHIVFSNLPGPDALDIEIGRDDALRWSRRIAQVAADRGLDPSRLAYWIDEVRHAHGAEGHPLHAWSRLTRGGVDADAERRRLLARLSKRERAAARAREHGEVVVDYGALAPKQLMQDGFAFGRRPVQLGEPRYSVDPTRLVVGVHTRAAAYSDPLYSGLSLAPGTGRDPGSINWVQSGRTLRTATLELNADALHYLVKGSANVVAVVDSHRLLQGPLHGAVVKRIGDGGWRWITHRLEDYRGHRMHVELTPNDGGSGFAVARIVAADESPGSASDPGRWLRALLAEPMGDAALATAYQKIFATALERFGSDRLAGSKDAEQTAQLVDWWIARGPRLGAGVETPTADPVVAAFAARRGELASRLRSASGTAPAMLDGSGVDERVLLRGNPSALGEVVPRRMLEALGGTREIGQPAGSGRLDLARRITGADNPLTARVLINRVWHHLFGRGIVASVDNFGVMGTRPSHPELLDHLALRFVADGWSIKRAVRSILLSSTYRMASSRDPAAERADPENVLLHRAPVRRLQGEIIRDAMLALSGRLDRKMFGKSVPIHLNALQGGRGRPRSGPLDGAGRRSIYLSVRRNFLSSMFLAFDYPIPFSSRGRRDVTNVPAQALVLMNNPFIVQQAGLWAEQVLADASDDRTRVERLYAAAFARPPTAAESAAALQFVARQRESYDEDRAAWADLCHALCNVKEFIYLQ